MNIEKYHLKSEKGYKTFNFISEGPKGAIQKRIEFQIMPAANVYNLAFGDMDIFTGSINDIVVSDNGDTEKVLATVVDAIYLFFDKHPETYIYIAGSTPSRTRLYRMGITRFYEQMQHDFYLYGQIGNEFVDFELKRNYDGFLAQKKY